MPSHGSRILKFVYHFFLIPYQQWQGRCLFSVYAREEWLLQIIDMSFQKILLCKNDFIVNLSAFNDLQPMQRRRIIFHKDIYIYKWCIWGNDLLNYIIVALIFDRGKWYIFNYIIDNLWKTVKCHMSALLLLYHIYFLDATLYLLHWCFIGCEALFISFFETTSLKTTELNCTLKL